MSMTATAVQHWVDMAPWDACQCQIDLASLHGLSCYGGFYARGSAGLSSLALVFPGSPVTALSFFWIPEDTAQSETRRRGVPYRQWAATGSVCLTSGSAHDYSRIFADIHARTRPFLVRAFAHDRFRHCDALHDFQKATQVELVAHGMGFMGMSKPIHYLADIVGNQAMCHEGNPVLRWGIATTDAEYDVVGNARIPLQHERSSAVGVVALLLALSVAISA